MSHLNHFLKLRGIIKEKDKGMAGLKSKQCPNCDEPNKPNIKFCAHCRMALTYDAYNEIIEEKQINDKEVQNLKNQMVSMQEAQHEILDLLKHPANDWKY